MFKNYQRLFDGYVDLYSASFLGTPQQTREYESKLVGLEAATSHEWLMPRDGDWNNRATTICASPHETLSPFRVLKSGIVNSRPLFPKGHTSGLLDPDLVSRLIDEEVARLPLAHSTASNWAKRARINPAYLRQAILDS